MLRCTPRRAKRLALAVIVAAATAAARADPGYYVVTAYDNEGQRTIDLRYWTVKKPGKPAMLWPEVGVGYGVSSRWHTELLASFIGTADTATRLDDWQWQNDVLLTQGQYPFDLAVHANLIRAAESNEGYALEIGPVLQTDVDRTQLNLNLFVERSYRTDKSSPTNLKYQWQIKQRWRPALQFGLQGFGELGEWDHWAPRERQSHRAGPAIFGTLPLGTQRSVIYQAAILKGQINGRNGTMFSTRVQLAF